MSKRTECRVLKRYLHTHIHSNVIQNSQRKKELSIHLVSKTQYICTMEWCYSVLKRKEILTIYRVDEP